MKKAKLLAQQKRACMERPDAFLEHSIFKVLSVRAKVQRQVVLTFSSYPRLILSTECHDKMTVIWIWHHMQYPLRSVVVAHLRRQI